MPDSLYKILVKDGSGNTLGEFNNFRDLNFSKRLNNYGQCSFQVPITDSKVSSLIGLRIYTIEIWRSGILTWAGEQANREGSLDDKGNNWATIYCFDWFEQLNSRYSANLQEYPDLDAGAIAWDLIDTTQLDDDGDLGITQGTIEVTTNRIIQYHNENVAKAITDLANLVNGFDFEINNSKVFNVEEFIGVDRTASVVLEYGVNVTSVRITDDFSSPVNRAIALGPEVDEVNIRIDRNDVTLQGTYKLREGIVSDFSATDVVTLQDKGDALIRKFGNPLVKLSLGIVRGKTPTIADFAIGDLIRVKIKSGIYNIDESYRIYEWQLRYDNDNTETIDLVLGNFNNPESFS